MIQAASQSVVMFVMNDLLNDPGVQREARSAVRAGLQVTVVSLQSDRCRIDREMVDGYQVMRVRVPRFMIMSLFFRIRGLVLLVELILKEGLKLTLGRLGLPVVVPLHPCSRAVLDAAGIARVSDSVRLMPPVSYHEMLMLERHARLILTDSGGIQKEAFLLGVPCITLRNETEWVETVELGWNRLAGTDPDAIVMAAHGALEETRSERGGPYGAGHAADAIIQILADYHIAKGSGSSC